MTHFCIIMNQITIVFVDRNPLVRKAWDFIMRQDARFKMLATCENGEAAIELSKILNPDILIADTNLPGMSWVEITRMITKNFPETKMIGLSYNIEEETAHRIILSGAMGCLSKMSYPDEIFKAIVQVYKGETYICKDMRTNRPANEPVERISSVFLKEKKVITMNKPRLLELAQ
jgi:DNA-binding NarL/FixJ family response regulator